MIIANQQSTIANQQSINVGLGELVVVKDSSVIITCIGLGSCIALCIYDPVLKMGGMAHMLLPTCKNKNDFNDSSAKYIDKGTPLLIRRMLRQGAERRNLIVKIVGGAKMLSIPGDNSHLDIGQKNISEVKAVLARENVPICRAEIGGSFGRTVYFYTESGRIFVKVTNGRTIEL